MEGGGGEERRGTREAEQKSRSIDFGSEWCAVQALPHLNF